MWAIKMVITLQAHDVWDDVEFGFSEPKDEVAERALNNTERNHWKKDKKKNAQALQLIR